MQGTPKAIEIKGIVRNATVIGAQDGQAEDIINMRFRNGAWRPAGKGRFVFSMGHKKTESGNEPFVNDVYSNLFIHTNVYRHILGVNNGQLWWFADISVDGDFLPKDNPFPICGVEQNDMLSVTQTGHLITIISDKGHVTHSFFNQKEEKYVSETIDENGAPTDRTLYPFGNVHFNLDCSIGDERRVEITSNGGDIIDDGYNDLDHQKTSSVYTSYSTWHADMLKAYREAETKNIFTRPFLAMVAVKLYDGTYAFASQPTLLWPKEKAGSGDYLPMPGGTFFEKFNRAGEFTESMPFWTMYDWDTETNNIHIQRPQALNVAYSPNFTFKYRFASSSQEKAREYIKSILHVSNPDFYLRQITHEGKTYYEAWMLGHGRDDARYKGYGMIIGENTTVPIDERFAPVYTSGANTENKKLYTVLNGADLLLNIDTLDTIKRNPEIFTGIGVFITPEVDIYETAATPKDNQKGKVQIAVDVNHDVNFSYMPKRREKKNIIHDLVNSPFFLLRDYSVKELDSLHEGLKVDLSDPKYEGVLKSISEGIGERFTSEAVDRKSYVPKVAYNYNGRLHLANYTTNAFYGYPLDSFLYNNHSGLMKQDAQDLGLYHFSINENAADPSHNIYQFDKTFYSFLGDHATESDLRQWLSEIKVFASVDVYVDTPQGEQKLTRYIEPYLPNGIRSLNYGVEDLPPFLAFPDVRATKMVITFTRFYMNSDDDPYIPSLMQSRLVFPLKPHPYLNVAYYMSPDMQPIKINPTLNDTPKEGETVTLQDFAIESDTEQFTHEDITNAAETFPNGVKVSSTDNPLAFPYKNTYLVGSAEIVAICSNTVAVGTGQTGMAPLYVFSKDGVYALMVGADGTMTYSNARAIARDVCNNKRSVVPIDAGVTFTTDRGLMLIAGEQVEELGVVAEGEPLRYTDFTQLTGRFTPRKIGYNILTLLTELDATLCDGVDFLAYLKGAAIAYNHNLRELVVSNPNYDYSYVLDSENNWKRYYMTADEYVNNYPTLYRVQDGEWFKIDEEEPKAGDTSGVVNDEADNKILFLSNVIKLDSIGFKQAYRFVVRGHFETQDHYDTSEVEIPAVVSVPSNITIYPNPNLPNIENDIVYENVDKEMHINGEVISTQPTIFVNDGDVCDISIHYSAGDRLLLTAEVTPLSEILDTDMAQEMQSSLVSESESEPEIQTYQYDLEEITRQQLFNYAFSPNFRNVASVRYVLMNNATLQVVWSRRFDSYMLDDKTMVVPLQAQDEVVHINTPGDYSLFLQLFADDVIDVEPSYKFFSTFTLKGKISSVIELETNAINLEDVILASHEQYMPGGTRMNAFAKATYLGYFDLVCDPEHTNQADKVCKFTGEPSANVSYIISAGNNILKQNVFSAEQLDDYTLRVYLCEKETDEDDNIILLPREDTTQTELALDTGENGSNESVTNEFMLRLDNLTADLEDAGAGAVNPFDETTRQLASSISHAYVPTTSTFSDNGTHVELTAACDSDKVAFRLNGHFSLGFRIKEGVPDETVMDNTITMGTDSFSFVLKDKTDDIVVSTFGPALTTEKIIDTNGFHFRMSFDFQKRFIDCEIKQGHVYAIYMQGSAQLSIKVDNYQWSDLFESNSNIYTWSCNCQFYDYTPVYKVGFILPEPEEDEEGNTIDNAARVLTDVEWERKLDYRTVVTSEGLQEGALDGIKNTVVDTTPAYRVSTNGLTKTSYLGVYVFGSYDGRKWALLGANEKTGRFRDIGCQVSHTDVKFLMFAIAGNLKGSSRIDYTEMSSTPSVLNTKIR